jgi:hypothetical protein
MWLQLVFFFITYALSMEIALTWNGLKKLNKRCKWKPTISFDKLVELNQNATTPFATTCSRLWLRFRVFTNIRSNFNYFGHFYNYVSIIENFIILVGWSFNLFSFMNRFICPISCITNQISHTLNVFYNDFRLYFNVCINLYLWYIIYHKYIIK